MNRTTSAYLAALGQILIIGLSFMFVKLALPYTDTAILLFWRFFFAWLALVLFKTAKRWFSKPAVASSDSDSATSASPSANSNTNKRIARKDELMLLALSVFFPCLFFGLQAWGLHYTTSVDAGVIFALMPALVAILATLLLGEKANGLQWAFIALTIIGVLSIPVFGPHASSVAADASSVVSAVDGAAGADVDSSSFWSKLASPYVLGLLLLFGSTFSSAMYQVLSRRLRHLGSPYISSYMTYVGMYVFAFCSFVTLWQDGYELLGQTGDWSEAVKEVVMIKFLHPLTEPKFLIAILYLGVLSSLVSSLLTNYALGHLPAAKVAIFNNLSPIIAILAGVFFLGEPLSLSYLVGLVLVLVGVVGMTKAKAK